MPKVLIVVKTMAAVLQKRNHGFPHGFNSLRDTIIKEFIANGHTVRFG